MKSIHILCATAIAAITAFPAAHAQETGRQLFTTTDPVDNADGSQTVEIFSTRWDDRCAANIDVTINSGFLPNVGDRPIFLGPRVNTVFSLEETVDIFKAAFAQWTGNRASFIKIEAGTPSKLPLILERENGFLDFINEATFEDEALVAAGAGGALGVSSSMALMEDTTFKPGDDIDGDGDPDVFNPKRHRTRFCADVDGDGDIEYPAGRYAAGTILENDVIFSSVTDWEREPTETGVDLLAVVLHEYGHSHGLTHSVLRTSSATDASAATMFPFIPATDPVSEAAVGSLHPDDLSASAHLYPEGTGRIGPRALQRGDLPFAKFFSVIKGEVVNPDGEPIFGAAVSAIDSQGNNIAVTYTGSIGSLNVGADGTLTPDAAVGGAFALAVPNKGRYQLVVEPVDGSPVPPGSINLETIVAGANGINDFLEESLDLRESSSERSKEIRALVLAKPGFRPVTRTSTGQDIKFITNEENVIDNVIRDPDDPFANIRVDTQISSFSGSTSGIIRYAERFLREDILEAVEQRETFVGANLITGTFVPSEVPIFTSLELRTGTVDPVTNEVTLLDTLLSIDDFAGQLDDDTPLNFVRPRRMTRRIVDELNRNPEADIFIVVTTDIDNTPRDFQDFPAPFIGQYSPFEEDFSPTSYLQLPGEELVLTSESFVVPLNYAITLRSVESR